MAYDWIPIRTRLWSNPKVMRIGRRLGIDDPDRVVGILTRMWGWADENADERGRVSGVGFDDLDLIIGVPGLAEAVSSVGWLDAYSTRNDGGIEFTDWDEYMSKSARRRIEDARRKRAERAKAKVRT